MCKNLPELLSSVGSAAKFIQSQTNSAFHRTSNHASQLPHQIGLQYKYLRFLPLGNELLIVTSRTALRSLPTMAASSTKMWKIQKEAQLYSGLFCFWAIFSHFFFFFQHCYSVPFKAKFCNSFSIFKQTAVFLQLCSYFPLCYRPKKCITAG